MPSPGRQHPFGDQRREGREGPSAGLARGGERCSWVWRVTGEMEKQRDKLNIWWGWRAGGE